MAIGRSTSPLSLAWLAAAAAAAAPHTLLLADPPCSQNRDPTLSSPLSYPSHLLSTHSFTISLLVSLLLISLGWLGWASSHVVSFPGLSGRATAIMNPIKALGLNDGGGLASPAIIGPHRQPARHQQPIIAIKSIRALSLARVPFELTAQGRLDQ